MLAAALLHLIEEYVWPGGFLRWMRSTVGLSPGNAEAVVLNLAFIGLVAAAQFSSGQPSIWVLSAPGLLLANGAAHVIGTIATRRYSPGVITSVLLFFPVGVYALAHAHADNKTVSGGIILGIAWMCVPLTVVVLRRALSRR